MKLILTTIAIFLLLGMLFAASVIAQSPGDGGWRFLNGPVAPGGNVMDIAVSPADPDRILALVMDADAYDHPASYLFRSDDGAMTWRQVHAFDGGVLGGVLDVALDPNDAEVALAGRKDALYRTGDGGLSWTQVYTMGQAVAITPNGDYYAAGPVALHDDGCYGELMGIARSQDAGRTWQVLHRFCASDAVRIMAAPAPDSSVYVAAWWDANKQERLWRSDDGVTWTDVLSDSVDSRGLRHWLLDFVINPTNPDVLFISDYFGLIRSLDRGETWVRLWDHGSQAQSHFPPEHAYAMAFGKNGVLTIAERWGYSDAGESHIYRSDDNGDTWWRALETLPRGVSRLIARPQSADALYAGLLDFGVYKGRASGGRWIVRNRGLQTLISVKDLAVSATDVDRVYVVGDEPAGGLFRSEDGGLTWTAIMTDVRLTAIDLYPGSSDSGWAGGNGVMLSFDSENTHLYRHMPEVINDIELYARSPHRGYLVGSSRGGGFLGRLETIVTPDSPSDFDYWIFLACISHINKPNKET